MKKIIENFLRTHNFRGKGRIVNALFRSKFRGVIEYKQSLIYVDTSELIGWYLYWGGGYENEINWVLPHFISAESVCIDVGANIGSYSVIMAPICKKLISIEPHPSFRESLARNIALNQFENVQILDFAISRAEGFATLYGPREDSSNKTATLKNLTEYQPQNSVEIPVQLVTLDSICKNEAKIDFIKIDCDWHDAEIILSAKETIKKHQPIILFEDLGSFPPQWDKKDDVHAEYEEAYKFLHSSGYSIYKVEQNKLLPESRELGVLQNMLAIPEKFKSSK